jgi:hypothetical protein
MRALLEKGNTLAALRASRDEGLGFAFQIAMVGRGCGDAFAVLAI